MLSRELGAPLLRPRRPLALRDQVADRKMKKGEATCIPEMNVMMACWKQNNFVDSRCPAEMKGFYDCVKNARLEAKDPQNKIRGGRLPPKVANTFLNRYPAPPRS
ncbi:hypothetical protein CRUP_031375 [Coryphaenoides rupestris]|nr:hypothetical protein CRUP_031375 [Coryphaenoides rupestris]